MWGFKKITACFNILQQKNFRQFVKKNQIKFTIMKCDPKVSIVYLYHTDLTKY
jgi:hypothetical protein